MKVDDTATRQVAPGQMLQMYETMLRIRLFEERISRLFAAGELPGFVHLSIGQEAIPAGIMAALRPDDCITSTHRGHGHILAKGGQFTPMFAELMGRATGYGKGKGGSMHIFSAELGVLGANGILGAGQPIAVGAALSAKLRGSDQVTVSFFGEGASAQGAVHEAMNLAALWALPVVFVCERNGYAELTPYDVHVSVLSLAQRGAAYGIPATSVNGTEVEAVYSAATQAVARARAGQGPTLLEAVAERWRGHYEGDPQVYRSEADRERLKESDPIVRWERLLISAGVATASALKDLGNRVEQELKAAVEEARAGPPPDIANVTEDVYA